MIEKEASIMMRCDEYDGALISDFGHVIRFDDDTQIRKRAIEPGWKWELVFVPNAQEGATK